MPLTSNAVRDILLDELRAKGYAPNPADVMGAVQKILAAASEVVSTVAAEVSAEVQKPSPAGPVSVPLPSSPIK